MSIKGIFVTGTDTGVGKTVAVAAIARLLHNRGCRVGVMKPITSGCIERDGRLVSEDAELLFWAAGKDLVDPDAAPYMLKAPLAPAVAAEREGVKIDFGRIEECYKRLEETHDFMIVEGAGGLMVPLAGGLLIADLVQRLALPLVVVARPNLGTVNHTFLTTFAASTMGIPVNGVIINNYPDNPDAAEEYAPHLIASLCGAPVVGIFPRIEREDLHEMVEALVAKLEAEPATRLMLRQIGAMA